MKSKRRLTIRLMSALCLVAVLSGGCKQDTSMIMNNPHNVRGVISYKRSFPDLNDTHLKAAKSLGIRPVASREEALERVGKLEELVSCDAYHLDSLTHSIPFLVPKANTLLQSIGQNFLDSLTAKGLNPNKIIVTHRATSSGCAASTATRPPTPHTATARPSTSAGNGSRKSRSSTDAPIRM